jgi:methylated-DNA-[protein]-cysteine S-methyltransferase
MGVLEGPGGNPILRINTDEVKMPAIATKMPRSTAPLRKPTQLALSVFRTEIGWFGLLGGPEGLARLTFGHATPVAAREALGADVNDAEEFDWSPQLRQRLEQYAAGHPVDFNNVEVVRSRPLTPFQQRVVETVRAIPRGETKSYGEVAALVGSPGAARAVGTVMATNPVPIIVPCHRVVGSAGGLGGFSAAGGVSTKQWMLDLESNHAS